MEDVGSCSDGVRQNFEQIKDRQRQCLEVLRRKRQMPEPTPEPKTATPTESFASSPEKLIDSEVMADFAEQQCRTSGDILEGLSGFQEDVNTNLVLVRKALEELQGALRQSRDAMDTFDKLGASRSQELQTILDRLGQEVSISRSETQSSFEEFRTFISARLWKLDDICVQESAQTRQLADLLTQVASNHKVEMGELKEILAGLVVQAQCDSVRAELDATRENAAADKIRAETAWSEERQRLLDEVTELKLVCHRLQEKGCQTEEVKATEEAKAQVAPFLQSGNSPGSHDRLSASWRSARKFAHRRAIEKEGLLRFLRANPTFLVFIALIFVLIVTILARHYLRHEDIECEPKLTHERLEAPLKIFQRFRRAVEPVPTVPTHRRFRIR